MSRQWPTIQMLYVGDWWREDILRCSTGRNINMFVKRVSWARTGSPQQGYISNNVDTKLKQLRRKTSSSV